MSDPKSKSGPKIAINAAMLILATGAMQTVAHASTDIVEVPKSEISENTQKQVQRAAINRDVRVAVSDVLDDIADGFGERSISIAQRHYGMSTDKLAKVDDFTYNADIRNERRIDCHTACHNACHSACHGSRSWR
ncbi:hypothetical protein ACQU0X_27220 [Pseudovibrio ascidiaceicola]|uniref:hypothetical protein n=1 Tax=Pseudovibrio ascidiaceicola TaxID=285279 RepID=UPI003D36234D